jgi:predicted nucleic acid-binding Zn ribbon protein
MTRAKYLGHGDRSDPQEISDLLGRLMEQATVPVDIRQGELVDAWGDVAPGEWALATPIGVRDGTLLVTVPDGATASLLRYQIESLLGAIEERYGPGLVAAVRLRVSRNRSPEIPRE